MIYSDEDEGVSFQGSSTPLVTGAILQQLHKHNSYSQILHSINSQSTAYILACIHTCMHTYMHIHIHMHAHCIGWYVY